MSSLEKVINRRLALDKAVFEDVSETTLICEDWINACDFWILDNIAEEAENVLDRREEA